MTVSQPFVGEIRMLGCNFAPNGWAFCNGQLVPIAQNAVLFDLLGTTYGGDGQNTYALPDLQGRIGIHEGNGPGLSPYILGERGGTEEVTLTNNQIPQHSHGVAANNSTATASKPAGAVPARTAGTTYDAASDATAMNAGMIQAAGGSLPAPIVQPVLAVNFCISMFGIFPSPT
jgi:microcystin-dependent protein